jgi:hypothetical protein
VIQTIHTSRKSMPIAQGKSGAHSGRTVGSARRKMLEQRDSENLSTVERSQCYLNQQLSALRAHQLTGSHLSSVDDSIPHPVVISSVPAGIGPAKAMIANRSLNSFTSWRGNTESDVTFNFSTLVG